MRDLKMIFRAFKGCSVLEIIGTFIAAAFVVALPFVVLVLAAAIAR